MDKYDFINEYEVFSGVYQVPVEVVIDNMPFLYEIFSKYIEKCSLASEQFKLYCNNDIKHANIEWRNELFRMPDYDKYLSYENKESVYIPTKFQDWDRFNGCYINNSLKNELKYDANINKFHISGLFYYPINGYREWHTNRFNVPGIRIYYPMFDQPCKSGMNFIINNEIKTLYDRVKYCNVFYVDSQEYKWHNVFSYCNRFSIGIRELDFNV